MKKLFTFALAIIAGTVSGFATDYSGGLPGLFSINAHGDQVCFAQGNLQYLAASGTWRFALNQYDCAGTKNTHIAADYNDWIDLFGWG